MWLAGNMFPHTTFKDIKIKNWCLFFYYGKIIFNLYPSWVEVKKIQEHNKMQRQKENLSR